MLGQLAERAADLHVPATLITFEPHPREFFQPDSAPPRLTRFREKMEALRRCGIERVVCLRFDSHLASLTPEEFIRVILLEGVGVSYLVVGDDFNFGKGRGGNFSTLQRAGAEHGFSVVNMHTFNIGDSRVSSTRIREALQRGDFTLQNYQEVFDSATFPTLLRNTIVSLSEATAALARLGPARR